MRKTEVQTGNDVRNNWKLNNSPFEIQSLLFSFFIMPQDVSVCEERQKNPSFKCSSHSCLVAFKLTVHT